MELYREFFAIINALNKRGLEYAVVGGIAMAFHSQPRFTRDIDILARPVDLSVYENIFLSLGYARLGEPWTLHNTPITIHRFGKATALADDDMIVIDLLIGNEERHAEIIAQCLTDASPAGTVRLASREDLIWMKQARGSKQDEADIERLREQDEQD
jgi:hypothetical protein